MLLLLQLRVFQQLRVYYSKCHEMFSMKSHVFLQLCNVLQHTYGLQHTRHIRLEESIDICLMILGQKACNTLVQERFQYYGETINRHFYSILKCLNIMSMDMTLHLVYFQDITKESIIQATLSGIYFIHSNLLLIFVKIIY